MHKTYTLIVPRPDRTGPTNVAVDIGNMAARSGWTVRLLFLSEGPVRDDLSAFAEVRRFRLSDLWRTRGVVHSHGLRPDLVAALFRLFGRCTAVSTLHGNFPVHLRFDYSPCVLHFTWRIWAAALRLLHHRVCISKSMVRFYKHQFPTWRFELAYNFRRPSAASSGTMEASIARWIDAQREAKRIVLIYVGSLNARKNVLPLVRSVLAQGELALLVCGQGDQMAAIRHETNANQEAHVLLAGQVTDPATFIAKSDLLVLPSFAEGLPLVTLEAAELGVPALLSNIAVHRELSQMGLGATFNHRDFCDFGAKAKLLALDRTPGSDAARKAVWRDTFAPEIGFQRYEQIVGA